ncbi:unnamed protein product [Phytophthora lilii]|uniref:Unnamed protein product n=1 Tax=Phytophthora lilii TaxID=2077276 RepID=A0A9W6XD05_9STRA|nr:unnamed protein product [Phytophthora lilii]
MDVEYIDEQEPQPIQIDDNYYSLPTLKPMSKVAESRFTLDDYNRISKNTSPAKVCMVKIAWLAQLRAKYHKGSSSFFYDVTFCMNPSHYGIVVRVLLWRSISSESQ